MCYCWLKKHTHHIFTYASCAEDKSQLLSGKVWYCPARCSSLSLTHYSSSNLLPCVMKRLMTNKSSWSKKSSRCNESETPFLNCKCCKPDMSHMTTNLESPCWLGAGAQRTFSACRYSAVLLSGMRNSSSSSTYAYFAVKTLQFCFQ